MRSHYLRQRTYKANSLEYYKVDGSFSSKEMACRADLKNAQKWRDTSNDILLPSAAQKPEKKLPYSVMKKRVLRLYDLKKSHNFTVKVDLLTTFTHKETKFIIDHLND